MENQSTFAILLIFIILISGFLFLRSADLDASSGQAYFFGTEETRTIDTFITGLPTDPEGYIVVPGDNADIPAASLFTGTFDVTGIELAENIGVNDDFLVLIGTRSSNSLLDSLNLGPWDGADAVIKLFVEQNGITLAIAGEDTAAVQAAVQALVDSSSSMTSACAFITGTSVVDCPLPTLDVSRTLPASIYADTEFVARLDIDVDETNLPAEGFIVADTITGGAIVANRESPTTELQDTTTIAWHELSAVDQSTTYKLTASSNPLSISGKWGLFNELTEGDITGDQSIIVILDSDGDGDPDDTDCNDDDSTVYTGATESCDGVDNDCDRIIDNDPSLPAVENQGVCSVATISCVNGVIVTSPNPIPNFESPEVSCDGLDNDCDGIADVGCECITGETRACSSDVGVCSIGVETCDAGVWPGTCSGILPQATDSCGDNMDNDCDGSADEACSSAGSVINTIRSRIKGQKGYQLVVGANADVADSLAAVAISGRLGIQTTLFNTNVADVTQGNYIVVGGPCANPATKTLEGLAAEGSCLTGYTDGRGKVQVLEGNTYTQIIVAGFNAGDTRTAGNAIVQHGSLNLDSTLIIVEQGSEQFSPVVVMQ